ncbi:MAG: fumarylacetoacetate hydrolase family protein [bacterium]
MQVYRLMTAAGETVYATPGKKSYRKVEGSLREGFEKTDIAIIGVEKILPPLDPVCIYGIGLNYLGHVEEWGERPQEPLIFMKAPTSVIPTHERIVLPEVAPEHVDFEAELAVVIGKPARNITASLAGEVIAGVTCANDVTARDCQKKDGQWVRAKSFDTFCPLGPCLQTDWQDAEKIEGRLNGDLYQEAYFTELIFSVPELVEYLSHQFTLRPGTVILTGTPEGVGFARDPEEYLLPGDTYEVTIPAVGTLENKVSG